MQEVVVGGAGFSGLEGGFGALGTLGGGEGQGVERKVAVLFHGHARHPAWFVGFGFPAALRVAHRAGCPCVGRVVGLPALRQDGQDVLISSAVGDVDGEVWVGDGAGGDGVYCEPCGQEVVGAAPGAVVNRNCVADHRGLMKFLRDSGAPRP